MTDISKFNLIDVDTLVQEFLIAYRPGISCLYKTHYHSSDPVALSSFMVEVTEDLRTGCVTFINSNPSLEGLFPYLFYIVNSYAKKNATSNVKKETGYLCPGCLFLEKKTTITLCGDVFKCHECEASLKNSQSPEDTLFFGRFSKHNKKGYKCPECNRFIPHPLYDRTSSITCPYFDCCFVGTVGEVKRMHHPNFQYNPENLVVDVPASTSSDNVCSQLIEKEELENKVKLISEIIESQSNSAPYSGSDFTLAHKLATYQAFKNYLGRYPSEMVDYLLYHSRSGFQHKIFQEYIRLLENTFPISYKKRGKIYRIDSLLDTNLNLFDGISVFDGLVSEKSEIKNGTKEIYIGGRKAAYTKPYYIGKLLSVINKNTKEPLISHVKEYSFSRIKVQDIVPGTEVTVTHLRVPPHYQMGGMVYINRLRKKIVDKAIIVLRKENE